MWQGLPYWIGFIAGGSRIRGDADIMAVVRASLAVATVLGLPAANAAAQGPGGAVQEPSRPWSAGSIWKLIKTPSKASRSSATGSKAPTAIALRWGLDRRAATQLWLRCRTGLSYTYEQPLSLLPRRNTAPAAAAPAIRRGGGPCGCRRCAHARRRGSTFLPTTTPRRRATGGFMPSTPSRPRPDRARRCIAPRSAPPGR